MLKNIFPQLFNIKKSFPQKWIKNYKIVDKVDKKKYINPQISHISTRKTYPQAMKTPIFVENP